MVELAKAAVSFGWAVSLMGAQQLGSFLLRPNSGTAGKSAAALMSVVDVAVSALDEQTANIYRAGVRVQNSIPQFKGDL